MRGFAAADSCEPPQSSRQADKQRPHEHTSTRPGIAPNSSSSRSPQAPPTRRGSRCGSLSIAEGATTLAFLGDRELVIREASTTARDLIRQACP